MDFYGTAMFCGMLVRPCSLVDMFVIFIFCFQIPSGCCKEELGLSQPRLEEIVSGLINHDELKRVKIVNWL